MCVLDDHVSIVPREYKPDLYSYVDVLDYQIFLLGTLHFNVITHILNVI